jgi:hypothetical protein
MSEILRVCASPMLDHSADAVLDASRHPPTEKEKAGPLSGTGAH